MSEEMNDEVVIEESQPQEKMLTQSEVNELVGRQKQMAAEKARRKVEQEYQAKIGAMQSQQTYGAPELASNNHVEEPQVDPDALYQQVQERFNQEMQQRKLEEEMNQVADAYLTKMDQGKELYEDFDDVTSNYDPSAFPQVTYLVSGLENAADIVYDLAKNPSKLVTIDTLAQRSPKAAQAELQKLSRSISENRAAQQDTYARSAPEPLDRVSPSRNTGRNAKMSIGELRNQPWLRG